MANIIPNQPPPLPPRDYAGAPNQANPNQGQQVQGQGGQVVAGGRPLLNNDPAVTGIINLDTAAEDPSTALLNATAQKAGCTVAELRTRGFSLEKGFRPEKDSKDTPIPVHSYSNPPGPDCYYFVRHWRVTVNDDQGRPMEMHFTKKIYTSVEVPRNLNPVAHKQQQYVAALAARTYANIEESRMKKEGTGVENELFRSVGPQMSKIAHDRFVTLEMFNNAKSVAINPTKNSDIKSATVDTVRLKFRASKRGVEGEAEHEGFHNIVLTPQALELKGKLYRFTADDAPSAHARKVANALNTDEALDKIRGDVPPAQAFADVGLNLAEVKGVKEGETKAAVQNFYSQLAYFGDKQSVKNLMANHDPARYELSSNMLNKITTEMTLVDRLRSKKPEELAALKKLKTLLDPNNNPTDIEKKEARKLLEAAKKVHANMDKDHKAITKLEGELELIGEVIDPAHAANRDQILDDMNVLLNQIESLLPPAPIPVPNPAPNPVPNQGNNQPVQPHVVNFDDDLEPPPRDPVAQGPRRAPVANPQVQPAPLQGQPVPLQGHPAPPQDEPPPPLGQPVPLQEQPAAPLQGQPAPPQDEPANPLGQPAPLQDEQPPLEQQANPPAENAGNNPVGNANP